MPPEVGKITAHIASLLGLTIPGELPIYLGKSNITHMMNSHPNEFRKYGNAIPLILSQPDYVGLNPSDDSIEYVKEFAVDNDFVKVAVRVSRSGNYYARSLYILNPNRVQNFIAKGTLKSTKSP